MTYEILLIVVIGGIGSISGSVLATFLYVACSEWWLRVLDNNVVLQGSKKVIFVVIFALAVVAVAGLLLRVLHKKAMKTASKNKSPVSALVALAAVGLLAWDIWFLAGSSGELPFLRNGFRMVVFSIVIMIVVLFFRQGIMGDKELPDLLKKRPRKAGKEAAK